MRWFKSPVLFASHVMNAFNDGTRIFFDTPVAKNNMFPCFPDVLGVPFNPIEAMSYLTRWSVDMASPGDCFENSERLTDLFGEFPRIDDRYATEAQRHGWLLVSDRDRPFEGPGGRASGLVMNCIAHLNFTSRQASGVVGGAANHRPGTLFRAAFRRRRRRRWVSRRRARQFGDELLGPGCIRRSAHRRWAICPRQASVSIAAGDSRQLGRRWAHSGAAS